MNVMEPREEDKVNIVMVKAEPENNRMVRINNDGLEMNTHIPEDLKLQELLDEQHQVDQCGPQAEDRGGDEHGGAEDGGEGAGGGRQEHGRDDDQVLRKTSTKLQLVRRRYRLKVGIRRDGLLQPTVNNFFVMNSGGGI